MLFKDGYIFCQSVMPYNAIHRIHVVAPALCDQSRGSNSTTPLNISSHLFENISSI